MSAAEVFSRVCVGFQTHGNSPIPCRWTDLVLLPLCPSSQYRKVTTTEYAEVEKIHKDQRVNSGPCRGSSPRAISQSITYKASSFSSISNIVSYSLILPLQVFREKKKFS